MQVGEQYANGRYTVVQKLGWGHFSTVWLVRDTATGAEGAMKVRSLPVRGLQPCTALLLQ